jgi:hypothetical protein
VYGTEGSVSVANPDLFDGIPRVRRAGEEERRQSPPAPGDVPWMPFPLTHDGDVGRGIGIADMAEAILAERPHRASGELACHVLEVLCALAASESGTVEIESRCERPAPLPITTAAVAAATAPPAGSPQ